MSEDLRETIAWLILIWCVNQGYVRLDDRIAPNWMAFRDAAEHHPDDVRMRDALLGVADEIIAVMEKVE